MTDGAGGAKTAGTEGASGALLRSALLSLGAGCLAALAVLATLAPGAADQPLSNTLLTWPTPDMGVRTQDAPADMLGSRACATCHADAAAKWAHSHHALAMAEADPQSVRGDFSGVSAAHAGSTARFRMEGARYVVETEGKDGRVAPFEVTHTFGWAPLQQYLVSFPDGRRQVLPWAYDTRPKEEGGARWFHLYDDPLRPGDALHWTGVQQTWNHMCAECHSTDLRKNYDAAKDTYRTTFSEVSVGCESCHGPGRAHAQWAQASPRPNDPLKGFAAAFAPRPPRDFTPDPSTGSPKIALKNDAHPPGDQVEVCARCHSRRGLLSEAWRPGRPLTDTHAPALLTRGLFEADGQMLDEVFNDHLFKQSKMYAAGVVCSDCHDPHSARLKAPGAEVCGQCHLPERFAAKAHTGHDPGPKAPDCISCHMPARTYMKVDVRHDHSFRIPRPDLTASIGVPNTCASCHQDKSATWAADAIASWHGPDRKGFQTYGPAFHAAREGDPSARDLLIALAKDAAQPGVVRATAIAELERFPSVASEEAVRAGLADREPLARVAALRAIAGMPVETRWRWASDLLADSILAVRLAAARTLADAKPDTEAGRKALAAAAAELDAAQELNADRPEERANRATVLLLRGDLAGAERELLAGLKLDPAAAELAVNLADLYRRQGREADADQTLRAALQRAPNSAALRHAFGLSLVRQKRIPEAVAELKRASDLDPGDARLAYVLVVALSSAGPPEQARAALNAALARNPNDSQLLGLALNDALGRRDYPRARILADRLVRLRPDDAQLATLAERLKAQ